AQRPLRGLSWAVTTAAIRPTPSNTAVAVFRWIRNMTAPPVMPLFPRLPPASGEGKNGRATWLERRSRRLFFPFYEPSMDGRSERGQDETHVRSTAAPTRARCIPADSTGANTTTTYAIWSRRLPAAATVVPRVGLIARGVPESDRPERAARAGAARRRSPSPTAVWHSSRAITRPLRFRRPAGDLPGGKALADRF